MCQTKSHQTKDKFRFSSHCTRMEIYPDSRSDNAQRICLVKYLSWERTKVPASWKYLTFASLALEVPSQIWWKYNKKIARRDLWLHITDLKSLIGTKVIFQEKKWPILKWWAALYLQNKKLFPLKASPFTAIIEWEYLIFPGGAGSHGIGKCSWVLK